MPSESSDTALSVPARAYAERRAARAASAAEAAARMDRLSGWRLAAFLAFGAVAGLSAGAQLFSPWFLLAPVLAFVYFVALFESARGSKAWAERAAAFYELGLARLTGKAPEGAPNGARFAPPEHPYAEDLDLFGPGSLFERITACRTFAGETLLADWLLAPAAPGEVKARQEAVADLAPRLDLREALAVAGADVPAADYAPLAEWGNAPSALAAQWKRWTIEVLGWANVLAWFGWLFAGSGVLPVLACGFALAVLAIPLVGWARSVLKPLDRAAERLALLETVLARFERERFTAPRLNDLQRAMTANGYSAAQQIGELRRLLNWFDSRRNPLFIPVAVLRAWDVRFGYIFEEWRARSGPKVAHWLRALAECEALASLAGCAFDNPADVFPEVRDGPVSLEAEGVSHPLLSAEVAVRNDVRLGAGAARVLIVSGSNMSGKSTLLRAVGTNAVLALAGGTVRAKRFALTPVSLGATMRVQDSLQAGKSRFFAEVTKVRLLLDIASRPGAPPLLFLLDELFAGTNSADRVAGAEGVVRALLSAGAVGFVTTHDLSLTAVTDQIPGAANVHFCDGFAGGELHFDYTMRPGVVPHGNGLALMRAVGLTV
jgi:MutS domain V